MVRGQREGDDPVDAWEAAMFGLAHRPNFAAQLASLLSGQRFERRKACCRQSLDNQSNSRLETEVIAHSFINTDLCSRNASKPSGPFSRPQPDCLKPPNGKALSARP